MYDEAVNETNTIVEEIIEVSDDTNNSTLYDIASNIYTFVALLNFVIIIIFLYKYLKNTFSFRKGV